MQSDLIDGWVPYSIPPLEYAKDTTVVTDSGISDPAAHANERVSWDHRPAIKSLLTVTGTAHLDAQDQALVIRHIGNIESQADGLWTALGNMSDDEHEQKALLARQQAVLTSLHRIDAQAVASFPLPQRLPDGLTTLTRATILKLSQVLDYEASLSLDILSSIPKEQAQQFVSTALPFMHHRALLQQLRWCGGPADYLVATGRESQYLAKIHADVTTLPLPPIALAAMIRAFGSPLPAMHSDISERKDLLFQHARYRIINHILLHPGTSKHPTDINVALRYANTWMDELTKAAKQHQAWPLPVDSIPAANKAHTLQDEVRSRPLAEQMLYTVPASTELAYQAYRRTEAQLNKLETNLRSSVRQEKNLTSYREQLVTLLAQQLHQQQHGVLATSMIILTDNMPAELKQYLPPADRISCDEQSIRIADKLPDVSLPPMPVIVPGKAATNDDASNKEVPQP